MIRILFAVLAVSVTGLLVAAEPQQKLPPVPVPKQGPDGVDPKMPHFRECAKACDNCARACDTCVAHCARMLADGKKEHLETLRLCQDCAEFCSAASRIVSKDGPLSDLITASCADACKRCGDACEKQAGDPIMKQCMEECRQCEKVCRGMAKPQ